MTKLVIAGKIHSDGMALLNAEPGLEIEMIEDPGAALPMESLSQADALLIRYGVITSEMANQMPNLRLVSRHGVGCDNLPTAELGARCACDYRWACKRNFGGRASLGDDDGVDQKGNYQRCCSAGGELELSQLSGAE